MAGSAAWPPAAHKPVRGGAGTSPCRAAAEPPRRRRRRRRSLEEEEVAAGLRVGTRPARAGGALPTQARARPARVLSAPALAPAV